MSYIVSLLFESIGFMYRNIYWLIVCLIPFGLMGQGGNQMSSVEVYEGLCKLGNTGTALYVAAHPDDENTRLISWLSNAQKVNTVYLSLTRGDGGQNLIGTEKGPLLGLLRTQELLEARKIDGGSQQFSRANDFGYSKTATETLEFWEKEKVLADVVWAIRKIQPDILINRFSHDSDRKTHGHHTASAMLSMEAFDLAGNPEAYPEQLKYVDVWQPSRIFFNTSWWFYGSREAFAEADKSNMLSVDVGEYYSRMGISNNEIASLSRSSHKCQGFGSRLVRGTQEEYLEFLKGDRPANMKGLFEGIDISWNRIEGGKVIGKKVQKLIDGYDFKQPETSLSGLLEVYALVNKLEDSPLKARKLGEIRELIKGCAGLYFEVVTKEAFVTRGETLPLQIEIVARNTDKAKLLAYQGEALDRALALDKNQKEEMEKEWVVPNNQAYTTPYWLNKPSSNKNMYHVDKAEWIGLPETPSDLMVAFVFEIGGITITFEEPIQYKYVDPAIGEIYEPLAVLPEAAVNLAEPVYLFKNGASGTISVEVKGMRDDLEGEVWLEAKGWTISEKQSFAIKKKGGSANIAFELQAPKEEVVTSLKAKVKVGGVEYGASLQKVEYDHIANQTVLVPAEAVIENINIKVPELKVAYIQGSGDVVPAALEQMDISVTELAEADWKYETLKSYDAVVFGIRAFNVHKQLKFVEEDLWKYVEEGGTLIVQYNTNRRLGMDIAPLPLKLSRDRITEEDANLKMLDPKHAVFASPNAISEKDFEGWVQERGLYFANEWDEVFTPLLEGHDKGEDNKRGALLVAPYGKGAYVYTGISFFRQLPAGVPGAYRLFVNLLSLKM